EALPGTEAEAPDLVPQIVDGREVADEGEAGPGREQRPGQHLAAFARCLLGAHGRIVETHARDTIAFEDTLYPEEDFRIDSLRAGVAAPEAAGHGSEQEQAEGRDD